MIFTSSWLHSENWKAHKHPQDSCWPLGLLATWIVKAWDLIPEELVRKSWTACGYKSEKHRSCPNGGTMVVFTDKQVGMMVEELCGEVVRSDFEDV